MASTATPTDLDHLRVDIVGSFLRPPALKTAFERHARGELDDAGLRAATDAAIRELVAKEEQHGLPVVSDGEFRRLSFMQSFAVVAGMEPWYKAITRPASERPSDPNDPKHELGNEVRAPVTERLRLISNALLDEYRFVAGVATRPATVTLIDPDRISQRYAAEASTAVYPGTDAFVDDVVKIEQQMIRELRGAGCRYVHMDAPGYTAYVDEGTLAAMRSRGEDPMRNFERSMKADNAIVDAFPDVTFGIHLCRGNSKSRFHRKGGYDAIAERMFNTLKHGRFLLEYDDERSGGFEPLRFVPKGKIVVLGLISSKWPKLESVDELRKRIDEAAKYLPLEQLALSPQCGFASGLEGNLLGEDDQWRKVDRMMETARLVWS
jgi:5-methyltetrahydropteroyltriglutamate--homocysteine methyltransferase